MKRIWTVWLFLILAAFVASPVLAQEAQTKDKVVMEEIKVKDTAEKKVKSGSAEAGYRVDSVSVGPLGNMKPLDTPYQINTVSSDLTDGCNKNHL